MSGIVIAAIITTAFAVAFFGWLIAKLAPREDRRMLLIAAVLALPLQPLAFYLLRLPLHGWLAGALGPGALLTAISLFYAPLTEEPAKWLLLALPAVRRRLTLENAVALALAIGLGFAIGEIWFLALRLAQAPDIAALPFHAFGGFLTERLQVCFLHGAFIAFAVGNLAAGRSFVAGGLIGIALHFALNFPIYLAGIDLFGLGRVAWTWLLTGWILGMTLALAIVVERISGGAMHKAMLGDAQCPECQTVYQRPWLALNFGPLRYERCPQCRRFHLTRRR